MNSIPTSVVADALDFQSVGSRLLGGWSLVSWQISFDDGRAPLLPFGESPSGLIVYSGDGWMNASIARAGRGLLSAGSVRLAPVAEQTAAFESYFNYAGPYSLREVDGQAYVVHRVVLALNPNFVGTDQVRKVVFDGPDRLNLSATESADAMGTRRHHSLNWQRAHTN